MPADVLIAGTGAMACLMAARLAACGTSVSMFGAWPEGLEAIGKHGVRLIDVDGAERAYPVRIAAIPDDCRDARYVLVLVKSWQTENRAQQLAACLPPDAFVLTLQNGLGNLETLAAALGSDHVFQGVTTLGANLVAPGVVRSAGDGTINIGGSPDRLSPLTDLLRQAGFTVQIAADTRSLLWGKLVINAAINPLTAILRVPNGALLEIPAAATLMDAAALEVAAVAAVLGIDLPYPDPIAAARDVARRTARNRSSMLQDVERRAPTEIDAICGAVVRLGEQAGVPTPTNRVLWLLVQALTPSSEG